MKSLTQYIIENINESLDKKRIKEIIKDLDETTPKLTAELKALDDRRKEAKEKIKSIDGLLKQFDAEKELSKNYWDERAKIQKKYDTGVKSTKELFLWTIWNTVKIRKDYISQFMIDEQKRNKNFEDQDAVATTIAFMRAAVENDATKLSEEYVNALNKIEENNEDTEEEFSSNVEEFISELTWNPFYFNGSSFGVVSSNEVFAELLIDAIGEKLDFNIEDIDDEIEDLANDFTKGNYDNIKDKLKEDS